MSAHGKKRGNGRAQLMLLRGGLDDFSGGARAGAVALAADEADWQSFCARIGWQDSDHDVADDYADRLAEKIFGGSQLRDNVIEIAVEREAKAVREQEMPVTPSALRRATARGALLALAGVAAAAVACFVGASVLSATGSTARAVPVSDPAEPVLSPAPVPSPEALPVESAPPVDSASPRTKPPGSLVAQRSSRHRSRGRAFAQQRSAAQQDHHAEVVQTALSAPVPLAEMIDIRPGALRDFDGPVTVPDVASLTPRHVDADLRSGTRSTNEPVAWSTPVTSRARDASPNWGLSSASQRWYGMGVAPTYEPSSLPVGMAVMAQVDVGKALKL